MQPKVPMHACRCAADSVEVGLVVVLHASKEQEAIVQSRCLGLTGADIHIIYML